MLVIRFVQNFIHTIGYVSLTSWYTYFLNLTIVYCIVLFCWRRLSPDGPRECEYIKVSTRFWQPRRVSMLYTYNEVGTATRFLRVSELFGYHILLRGQCFKLQLRQQFHYLSQRAVDQKTSATLTDGLHFENRILSFLTIGWKTEVKLSAIPNSPYAIKLLD